LVKTPNKSDTNCPKNSGKPSEVANTDIKTYENTPIVTPKAVKTKPNYKYNARAFGRPSKYRPKYCQMITEYFDREHTIEVEETHTNRKGETWSCYKLRANAVPTLYGFSASIFVPVKTLWQWKDKFQDFGNAYSHAQALQLDHLNAVTGLGLYNANWAVFMAKNVSSWRDKKELEHSGTLDSNIFIEAMIDKSDSALKDEQDIMGRLN
jgi:hypothetical protein